MPGTQLNNLAVSIRAVRDAVESKLRMGQAGGAGPTEVAALQALERGLEELRVMWENLEGQSESILDERQRYADLFEFAPDAYLTTDPFGAISEANVAAAILLRATSAYLIGKPIEIFVPLDERRTFRRELIELIGGGGGVRKSWGGRIAPSGGGDAVTVEFSVGGIRRPGRPMHCLCWLLRPVPG